MDDRHPIEGYPPNTPNIHATNWRKRGSPTPGNMNFMTDTVSPTGGTTRHMSSPNGDARPPTFRRCEFEPTQRRLHSNRALHIFIVRYQVLLLLNCSCDVPQTQLGSASRSVRPRSAETQRAKRSLRSHANMMIGHHDCPNSGHPMSAEK